VRHETYRTDDDPDMLIVAYGTVARIARTSIDSLREKGLKVGLFRPVTLYPYPAEALKAAAGRAKHVLVAELSMGRWWRTSGRSSPDGARGLFRAVRRYGDDAEELAEQAEKLAAVPA